MILILLILVPSLVWAAPSSDWSGSAYLVSHWRMNDNVSGFGATIVDSTGRHPLTTGSTTSAENTNIFEGGLGQGLVSSNQFNCQSNGTCTPNVGDFDFGGGTGPFSCFFYMYPTSSSIPESLFGTNIGGLLFGGWKVYRDTGPVYCFESSQSLSFTSTKVCTTSAAAINTGAMVMISMEGTNQRISMNGNAWEASAVQAGDITSPTSDFYVVGEGTHDFAGCWIGALDLPSFRKILVCDIDGSDCTCNDGDNTLYSSRPRHSSEGGLITGTMAPCNQADPTFDSTPPTTTSTTVVTTTSTSTTTSSSTTTSTAGPGTSTSTTLVTTTTLASTTSTSTIASTTSTSTSTSTSSTTSTTFPVCSEGCIPCASSPRGCCSGICGRDGVCKRDSGHAPREGGQWSCFQYNLECTHSCQCCDGMECIANEEGILKCREPESTSATTTSSSTSTSTSTSTTTTTSTSSTSTSTSTTTSSTNTTTTSSSSTTSTSSTSTSSTIITTTSTSLATTTSTSSSTTTTTSTTSSTAPGETTSTSTSSSTTSSTSTSSTTSSSTSTSSTTSSSTSSTSTSTSTSSTTSTSSSTTTSTSSTTSTTTMAPDWSDETALVLYLKTEQSTPASQDLVDGSPATNNLSSGTCSTATSDTTNFWEGTRALLNSGVGSDTCSFGCTVGDGCTDGTLLFTSGDFTCGFWARPTATAFGFNHIMGTAAGWEVYRNGDGTNDWVFEIVDGTDLVSVDTTTTTADDSSIFISVRYDATANSMIIRANGQQEDSATQDSPGTGVDFTLMGSSGGPTTAYTGRLDHIYCWNKALMNTSLCRVEVCGIDGSLCTCSGSTYMSKPKHNASGGTINCTLPACNTASPSYIN